MKTGAKRLSYLWGGGYLLFIDMVNSVVNNGTDWKNRVSFFFHCLYSVLMIFITKLGTDGVSG